MAAKLPMVTTAVDLQVASGTLASLHYNLAIILHPFFQQEKDAELASLKAKLHSASPDKAELESRLRELTESLIQKQTTLETLNSERHSLNLQMQRLQVTYQAH